MKKFLYLGQYAPQLRHWFEVFGRDKFLILPSVSLSGSQGSEVAQDMMARIGSFLGAYSGHGTDELKAMPHTNRAEHSDRDGFKKFRIEDLDKGLCRQFSALFNQSNHDLYSLLDATRASAPAEQPKFLPFEVRYTVLYPG